MRHALTPILTALLFLAPSGATGRDEDTPPAPPQACSCAPSIAVLGPFACACNVHFLVGAIQPGPCSDTAADPPCAPLGACTASVRVWWFGANPGCFGGLNPEPRHLRAACGTHVPSFYGCPVGLGGLVVDLSCDICKP